MLGKFRWRASTDHESFSIWRGLRPVSVGSNFVKPETRLLKWVPSNGIRSESKRDVEICKTEVRN